MRKRMGWIQAPVLSVLILGLMTAGHADDYGMGEGAPTAAQEIRHGHLNGIVWARQWIDSFSTDGFELGALMDMYADDVQFEDVIFSCDSKAELTKYFAASELPEAGEHTFTFESYVGDASAGVVEWTWHAKHMGEFLGVPAKGKETTVKGVTILTFRGGKIASQHDYWDAVGALKQLGAM